MEAERIKGKLRMAKASLRKKPLVTVSYEQCTILSSIPMRCFLCGVETTPMVRHDCSRPEAVAK